MPIAVIPDLWSEHTGGQRLLLSDAPTLAALLDELRRQHPGLERWLDNGRGNLPAYTHVFVGDTDARTLGDFEEPLAGDTEVRFVAEMSGG